MLTWNKSAQVEDVLQEWNCFNRGTKCQAPFAHVHEYE